VPEDIVNVTDNLKCSSADRCRLSEFIHIDTSENPEYLVKVMSNSTYKGQTPLWTLNNFEHDLSILQNTNHFTYINTTVQELKPDDYDARGLSSRPQTRCVSSVSCPSSPSRSSL
jgi:hypothetical protein